MNIRAWEKNLSLLALERITRMPFQWAIGLEGSKFFQEIAEREVLVGIKCPRCGKVYVPPRKVCGPCFVTMNEIVELGQEGVVEAVTLVNYPFIDPDISAGEYGKVYLIIFQFFVKSSNSLSNLIGVIAIIETPKLMRRGDDS